MRHAFVAASLLLSAGQADAAGNTYLDSDNGFRVTVPDGWKEIKQDIGALDLVLVSPRFDQTDALCGLLGDPDADSKSLSQQQLNDSGVQEIDEAFWRSVVEDQDTKVDTVERSNGLRNGRRVHTAVVRYTTKREGREEKGQAHFVLQLTPGSMFMGTCFVSQQFAAVEGADIATILESFGPGTDTVAARRLREAPTFAPARLTVFAGPRLDGARRVFAQDAPNLAQAGWGGWTGSFSVAGRGVWEICDGVNYNGNCRVVAGAQGVAFGDRALRIGSARRIAMPGDPRNILGVAGDAMRAALNGIKATLSPRRR